MAQYPEATVPEEEGYLVIDEEGLPLGNLPQTGDTAHIGAGVTGLLAALASLGAAGATLLKKKGDGFTA
jgi:LPXTG-motif cell wall-anchored protein